ncbi:hypothetical protein C8R43DRAFT_1127308 [Mycena crocata]|nr:hypothetical protein C8R43DRAFT_1127308 [Mycena crocata]
MYPTPPLSRGGLPTKREHISVPHLKREESKCILQQAASSFASISSPNVQLKSEANIDLLHVSPAAQPSSDEVDELREHSTTSTAPEPNTATAAASHSSRAASEEEEEVDQLDADDEDSDTSDLFTDVYSETEGAIGRFLRTPTAQQFHDKLSRPIKTYRRKVLCHEARAACRAVQAHIDNLSQIGRAFGVKHHQIRKAVLNGYKPPDDISRDHEVLHPDYRIHFPPLPPPPVTNTKPSASSKVTTSHRHPTGKTGDAFRCHFAARECESLGSTAWKAPAECTYSRAEDLEAIEGDTK